MDYAEMDIITAYVTLYLLQCYFCDRVWNGETKLAFSYMKNVRHQICNIQALTIIVHQDNFTFTQSPTHYVTMENHCCNHQNNGVFFQTTV